MNTTELLEDLDSSGHHLMAKGRSDDELAKGLGLALLALSQLIKSSPGSDTPVTAALSGTFKAKSNRW